MIPAQYQGLNDITIRGFFWQKAKALDAQTNFTQDEINKFILPVQPLPSLDDCLKGCVTEGKRVIRVDGNLAALRTRGWDPSGRLTPLLVALIEELDRRFPEALPELDPKLLEQLAKCKITQPTIALLNSMVRYAALNVTSFPTAVPAVKLSRIKNRSWAALQKPDKKSPSAVPAELTRLQLKKMAEDVLGDKSGVCTSFAATATQLILSDPSVDADLRIEYLGGTAHCICVLNRKDHTEDKAGLGKARVTQIDNWNREAIIIDPWSGAMGNRVFYSRPYCHTSMFGGKIDRFFDGSKEE